MDPVKAAIIKKLCEPQEMWKQSPKEPMYKGQIGTKGAPPIPHGYTPNVPETGAEGEGVSYNESH